MELTGKGIGREISVLLHHLGAQVVALSRTKADLDSLHKVTFIIIQFCHSLISYSLYPFSPYNQHIIMAMDFCMTHWE